MACVAPLLNLLLPFGSVFWFRAMRLQSGSPAEAAT